MNEQNSDSDFVERTDRDTNNPVVIKSDPFADKDPVDAALIEETPMGGTIPPVGPFNGTPADEIPMFETPNQEIPMGGTIPPVGPMNKPPADDVPMFETTDQEIPMDEMLVHEAQIDDAITNDASTIDTNPEPLTTLPNGEESEQSPMRWNEI